MADQGFSYTTEIAKAGDAPQDAGFFTEWFLNMFAGAIDIQSTSPVLFATYCGVLVALVILRLYTENPIKSFGCAGLYVYTTVQAYSLYGSSSFVVD